MAALLALLTILSQNVLATPTQGLQCREVVFHVSASAQNRNISSVNFGNLDALTATLRANSFERFEVSGKQAIAGWYCEPTRRVAQIDKLQVFLGSITTNRELWTGLGGTGLYSPTVEAYEPETYSWTKYANERGYATLTLDHLGNGRSSHPDPMNVVQSPYEVALYHAMIQQIKTGPIRGTSPLPRAFQHLAYVGNSYGSIIGNLIAQSHPEDLEEVILTGFSKSILPSLPGIAAQGAKPAKEVDPRRFGTFAAGYLTSPVEQTRTNSFFGDPKAVDFDPKVAHLFFARKDVVSTGQFVSAYVDIVEAPRYKGRVLVLTGEQDQAFCGPGSSAINPNPSCGNLLKETASLFPNARDYSWKSLARTGHIPILSKSAPEALRVAHEFLAGKRFVG